MNKRDFIRNFGFTTLGIMGSRMLMKANTSIFEQDKSEYFPSEGVFTLPPLGYAYNALEPNIDAQTMEIHYTKHHQGYVNNLNDAIKDKPQASWSLEKLCLNASASNEAIRNNAGGHYNHSMFWQWLSPTPQVLKEGALKNSIVANFGSVDAFMEKFESAAKKRFGSGWAWLVKGDNGKLYIYSTPNQDNPLMKKLGYKGRPLLGVDVWEHAYYLKYQNKRADYLKNFWNIVNWDRVAALHGK
ncbi:MAG TPA: superoxide dismutase, partial [Saprospiraceae bacterium]|nr:superoxide dismutase [Saprospiraceae bacterium]HQW57222.1 superoxide dismutase [Saprospiraceae bacterium]